MTTGATSDVDRQEVNKLLTQGFKTAKEGRREEAYNLFCEVVRRDSTNELGWLYRAATTEDLSEAYVCLQRVLAINPANQKALRGLERIQHRLSHPAGPDAAPVAAASAGAAPAGAASEEAPRLGEAEVVSNLDLSRAAGLAYGPAESRPEPAAAVEMAEKPPTGPEDEAGPPKSEAAALATDSRIEPAAGPAIIAPAGDEASASPVTDEPPTHTTPTLSTGDENGAVQANQAEPARLAAENEVAAPVADEGGASPSVAAPSGDAPPLQNERVSTLAAVTDGETGTPAELDAGSGSLPEQHAGEARTADDLANTDTAVQTTPDEQADSTNTDPPASSGSAEAAEVEPLDESGATAGAAVVTAQPAAYRPTFGATAGPEVNETGAATARPAPALDTPTAPDRPASANMPPPPVRAGALSRTPDVALSRRTGFGAESTTDLDEVGRERVTQARRLLMLLSLLLALSVIAIIAVLLLSSQSDNFTVANPPAVVPTDTAAPVPTDTLPPPTATAVPATTSVATTAVVTTAAATTAPVTTAPTTTQAPTPTATPVPPTATAVPPTATSVPPTATPLPPTPTAVPPPPAPLRPRAIAFPVKSGDNLTRIAEQYSTSTEAIRAANRTLIPASGAIFVGNVLVIPVQRPDFRGRAGVILGQGQTLQTLANIYQLSVEELARFNGYANPADARPGDAILIP